MPARVYYWNRPVLLTLEIRSAGPVTRITITISTIGGFDMRSKKHSLYDAQESQLQKQSAGFVELLMRKGMLEDPKIDDEKIRKAKKSTVQKAYHNTEVLLEQYRLVVWVLECVPGEIAQELLIPVQDVDALAERIELETTLGSKRIENRVNTMMKTRFLVDRVQEALTVLRKKPGNGELLYSILYATYIDPEKRKHEELLKSLDLSSRTYYRLRREAITILSIRLWSAPSGDIDAWLEVLTLLENL